MTNRTKIEILDTTLRDGLQSASVNYSLEDKKIVIELLSELSIDVIEAGMPLSNRLDYELLRDNKCTKTAAFTNTFIKNDFSELRKIADLPIDTVVIYAKAISSQVRSILAITENDNLKAVVDSMAFFKDKRIIFDAEHFFDGYKENPSYAMSVLNAALSGGADTVALCDTNGGTLPEEIYSIVSRVAAELKGKAKIGIHCHNDAGLATANTIAAVRAGAEHIQGTLLGFGERAGNACLSTLIPTLQLKYGYDLIGDNLIKLTDICNSVADTTNINLDPMLPYVGKNAFLHKAGMHVDAMLKDEKSYQHIDPASVGNDSALSVSLLSGKANVSAKAKSLGMDLTQEQNERLLCELKKKEAEGYAFDGADAGFIVFVNKLTGKYKNHFDLIDYRVISDETGNNSAMVKITTNGSVKLACGEGLGPVHALDTALRSALATFYPEIVNVTLIDYKVRVLDSIGATAAKVRVVITSSDGNNSWSNVGVSADIIEASYMALAESINYYLTVKTESVR